MSRFLHKVFVLCAAVMMMLFTVAVLLAHLLPPPSPTQQASTVQHYYNTHLTQVRIGTIVGMFATAFFVPFAAALAWEIKKMVGDKGKTLAAYAQVMFGTMFVISLFMPWFVFMAATFRPDRDPNITQGLYDLGWLMFLAPVSGFVLQMLLVGYAILTDKQPTPTFPRWVAYYIFLVSLESGLSAFCVLTKTGPFAWNGVLAYYLPLTAFGSWLSLVVFYLLRAVDREWAPGREAV